MQQTGLEAKTLGQLLLMQSIVMNLPDWQSISSFVCKGLTDIPGVVEVHISAKKTARTVELSNPVYIPIQLEHFYGELKIQLQQPDAFAPYLDYVHNFAFMLGIILEERKQRAQNEAYQKQLEDALEKQKAASDELEILNEELRATNEELYDKNCIIEEQNRELQTTLKHLKDTQAQLMQIDKMASLGTLTAGISHEINNPLQYLSGSYYALHNYFEKYGSADEKTTSFLLSSTETAITRISSIVHGLNQFSRDNSSFDETCDLHMILDNCLAILHNQSKDVAEIKKDYKAEKLYVQGNVGKLHQVFTNILTNALQALPDKGEIFISSTVNAHTCCIEISDTGCGISKENMAKITEPFFTTKAPGKGTGLGLSISYAIIQDHQGSLEFESKEGQGTSVRVTLPLKDATKKKSTDPSPLTN